MSDKDFWNIIHRCCIKLPFVTDYLFFISISKKKLKQIFFIQFQIFVFQKTTYILTDLNGAISIFRTNSSLCIIIINIIYFS